MTFSVFVPGHITGFFNIAKDDNPLKSGSCGCGFLLNKGVTTQIKQTSDEEISILINGKKDIQNETIIKEVLKLLNITKGVEITQNITLPIGAGFGTSAASALGVSIGLNNIFSLDNPLQIAHTAEINLGTGLGDVIAETGKGIVLRNKPGAPNVGEITSFDEYELYIGCKTFNEINTSSIIKNKDYENIINKEGIKSMKNFLKDKSVENFLKESLNFAINTKLINENVLKAVEVLNNDNNILGSSMAMLGDTVFAFSDNKKSLKNSEIKDLTIYKLNNEGIIYD